MTVVWSPRRSAISLPFVTILPARTLARQPARLRRYSLRSIASGATESGRPGRVSGTRELVVPGPGTSFRTECAASVWRSSRCSMAASAGQSASSRSDTAQMRLPRTTVVEMVMTPRFPPGAQRNAKSHRSVREWDVHRHPVRADLLQRAEGESQPGLGGAERGGNAGRRSRIRSARECYLSARNELSPM